MILCASFFAIIVRTYVLYTYMQSPNCKIRRQYNVQRSSLMGE